VWPIIDGSPPGTTLHVMTNVIDGGDILAQRKVHKLPSDTALSLSKRLEEASVEMFTRVWPNIAFAVPKPQSSGGTSHRLADLADLDLADADFATLDKLRARTFPPYGAEFERAGRRYRAQVSIEEI
jgi:methionyl-tRNA formyltransferase